MLQPVAFAHPKYFSLPIIILGYNVRILVALSLGAVRYQLRPRHVNANLMVV